MQTLTVTPLDGMHDQGGMTVTPLDGMHDLDQVPASALGMAGDVHALSDPVDGGSDAWPELPHPPTPDHSVGSEDAGEGEEGLYDLDESLSGSAQIESPSPVPAPALLKRRSGAISMGKVESWQLRSELAASSASAGRNRSLSLFPDSQAEEE